MAGKLGGADLRHRRASTEVGGVTANRPLTLQQRLQAGAKGLMSYIPRLTLLLKGGCCISFDSARQLPPFIRGEKLPC